MNDAELQKQNDSLIQEEVYIKLKELISRIDCKGWHIEVFRPSSKDIIAIQLSHPTTDSYDRGRATLEAGIHLPCGPILTGSESLEGIARIIYERMLSLTIHEFQENFKVDGKIVMNPHFRIEEK